MRGKYAVIEPAFGVLDVSKSLLAIPVYATALPLLFLIGQHHFMRYLEKLCFHLGKILAALRLNPIAKQYISD